MAACTTISLIDYLQSLPEASALFGDEQILAIRGGQAYVLTPTLLQNYFALQVVTLIGDGGNTYTNAALQGVTILDQFIDVNRMLSSEIAAFDNVAGQIDFVQPIDSGKEITLHCIKNF